MFFLSPAGWAIGGVASTLIAALVVVIVVLRSGGTKALSDHATLIGALVALGGVLTAQFVTSEIQREQAQNALEVQQEQTEDEALQAYLDDLGNLLIDKKLAFQVPRNDFGNTKSPESSLVRARTLALLETINGSGHDPRRDARHKKVVLEFCMNQT